MKPQRIALFGGTFDPVHYGHLLLAEVAREQCDLDEVWFVPAAVPPHKQEIEVTSGEARAEMIELAVAGNPGILVSRFELERGGVSYTVDTLRRFREETPDAELFFLLGADMLHDLPNWREAGEVCRLATPIVARVPEARSPGPPRLRLRCRIGRHTPCRLPLLRLPIHRRWPPNSAD